jgi:hypothetical protein
LKLVFINSAQEAVEVIKWFNNHSRALGILRKEQLRRTSHPLALIMAVITRWTTHYLSMQRLLELSKALRAVVDWEYKTLMEAAGTKDDAPARAEKVFAIIKDTHFWENLARSVLTNFVVELFRRTKLTNGTCTGWSLTWNLLRSHQISHKLRALASIMSC